MGRSLIVIPVVPPDDSLESLYRTRIRETDQLIGTVRPRY